MLKVLGVLTTLLLSFVGDASGAEIRLLYNPGSRAVVPDIVALFERSSGHKVSTTMEVSAALKRRIDAGEPFDAVIMTPPSFIDGLIDEGKVVANSRTSIARTGMSVIARSAEPKRDISSVDSFKRMVLSVSSIAYLNEGAPGRHFLAVSEQLGIVEAVKPKLRPTPNPDDPAKGIASGQFDLGLVTSAAPLVSGVERLGPFPDPIQAYEVPTGGVSASSTNAEVAKALLRFFSTPEAVDVIKSKGMELVKP